MSKETIPSVFSAKDGDVTATIESWEKSGILTAHDAHDASREARELKQRKQEEEERYVTLTESAKARMEEMAELFGKVKISTATKKEMDRLAKLDDKMKDLKRSILRSKSMIKSYTDDMVRSMSRVKSYELMKTVKEHDIRGVVRCVREAEKVDLAFILDCTSSMSPYLDASKKCVKDVVQRVMRTNDNLKLRVAVVGYRDLCDGHKRFEVLDFTSSVDAFETFVSKLEASGGGDAPEDIAGAFQKANLLSWKQASRVTFLIADAPCHGIKYHSLADDHPAGTPGISIETELNKLTTTTTTMGDSVAEAGMQLHFGRITSQCDKMIRTFRVQGYDFDVCEMEDPGKLTTAVSSSVRKSISKTVSVSRSKSTSRIGLGLDMIEEEGDGKVTKKYTICEAKPTTGEWKSFKEQEVKVLCNKPIKSVNDMKAPLLFGFVQFGTSSSAEMEERKMLMLRAKSPFAEGEMRLAYYGRIGTDKDSLMSSKNDKILKSFKRTSSSMDDRKRYLAQMEVSTISHFLAEDYNKKRRPSHLPSIRFLNVYVIEVNDTARDGDSRYCAEDQLPGAATAFTKYSNNTGYWNEDEINQSLLLFTKYTYEKTGGYLMVTDLQGVRNGNQYILTDPAILCKDSTRFGGTNLGRKFMEKCMNATEAMLEEYGWND